jgi:hypothetical protein
MNALTLAFAILLYVVALMVLAAFVIVVLGIVGIS